MKSGHETLRGVCVRAARFVWRRAEILTAIAVMLLAASRAVAQTGAYTLSGGTATETSLTENATSADQSGIFVYNSGVLTVGAVTVTTSGNASSTDNSDKYGVDAGILAGTSGSTGTILITGTSSSVTTTGAVANGLFATGSGSSISMAGGTITASGANAHGVDATFGGSVTLTNVDVTTSNASSSAIATDFGGGTVTVTGGNIVAADTASGSHSAGIYSTGTITVTGATVRSKADYGGVIDGANSIHLTHTSLTGATGGFKTWKTAPASGPATITVSGGSLEAETGNAFDVTGSTGNAATTAITVSGGAAVTASAGKLLNVDGGSTATFEASGETLKGDLIADTASTATISLASSTSLTGTVTHAALSLDATSSWSLTGNSTLTTLSDAGGISGSSVTNITGNGYNASYDASLSGNGYLGGLTYSLAGGGQLAPAGTPTAVPAVTGVSPSSGPTAGGTAVTVAGTNFTGATAVSFGGTAATSFTVASATSITAVSPTHAAGTVDVTVTSASGTSSTGTADQFTYGDGTCTLTCTATVPTKGSSGQAVQFQASATTTCTGTVGYSWTFGDGSTSSEQSPAHTYASSGSYSWSLTAMASTQTCQKYGSITVSAAPAVASVKKLGDPFRLSVAGSGFQDGCAVTIDGASVPSTKYKSAVQVLAKGSGLKEMVPKGTTVQVRVVNPDGTASAAYAYAR